MTYNISRLRFRPILLGTVLALLLPVTAAALPAPAAAQDDPRAEIGIAVASADLTDDASLRRVKRQIGRAAAELCDTGSVSSIYGNGARRCRALAIADAERQLQQRLAGTAAPGRQASAALISR